MKNSINSSTEEIHQEALNQNSLDGWWIRSDALVGSGHHFVYLVADDTIDQYVAPEVYHQYRSEKNTIESWVDICEGHYLGDKEEHIRNPIRNRQEHDVQVEGIRSGSWKSQNRCKQQRREECRSRGYEKQRDSCKIEPFVANEASPRNRQPRSQQRAVSPAK